ncbi:unnamed protein product [Penicillium nalgiovense]|nr:unnamed protein product [Penicillium nalgiovense]
MAFYDGYNVDGPQGLLAWQTHLIQQISPKRAHAIAIDKLPSSSTATSDEREALQQAEQEAHHTAKAGIQPKNYI